MPCRRDVGSVEKSIHGFEERHPVHRVEIAEVALKGR